MSGYDVLLFVGATTLVAAIVTLFLLQMSAARFERRMNRRSRTLEGPVPGRRSLSTIGLNTESARTAPRPPRPPARKPSTLMEQPPTDTMLELALADLTAPSAPSFTQDARLNSLQTIRARSAALNSEVQADQSAGPTPLTLPGTASVQKPSRNPASELDQEQGPATSRPKTKPGKAGSADIIPAPVAEAAEPTIAPRSPTSKRPRRNNGQGERISATRRGPDQPLPDAPADLPGLDLLAALQPSDIGGSLSRDGSVPDIFAGLNEPDAGIQGLADDLSDIDGGGLPTPPPKTTQRSRR